MTHSRHRENIIILGRGLAGLAAALVLAQRDYAPTIIAPAARLTGGLQLAPNGLAALAGIGIADTVRRTGTKLGSVIISSLERGHELACIEHHSKRSYYSAGRADLATILTAELGKYKQVRFIEQMATSLDHDAGGRARLVLDDGQLITASHVLCADGARGRGRAFVSGASLVPAQAPLHAMRADIDARELPRLLRRAHTHLMLGRGCHFVCYPICRSSRVNAVFCAPETKLGHGWQERYFAPHPVLKYLTDTKAEWTRVPVWSSAAPASWRRGAYTLIGDAAHVMPPHLAQGAGQGFVDAAVLKTLLASNDLDSTLTLMPQMRARTDRQSYAGRRAPARDTRSRPRHCRTSIY